MSDATPRTIYKGRFVAKEKLDKAQVEHAELKAQLAELDDMLVVSHLGTLDSFKSVAHAVRALVEFDLSAEKYFDGQQLAALREFAFVCIEMQRAGLSTKDAINSMEAALKEQDDESRHD